MRFSRASRRASRAPGAAAVVVSLALLPATSLLAGACAPREGDVAGSPRASRPDLIVVLLDTVRADALGSYGCPVPATPWLDRLASRGVRFDRAVAMSPWTQPSMVALFTGLPPSRFYEPLPQKDCLGRGLPSGVPSLAERLHAAGYFTAAVADSPWLRRDNGMARGFDTFDEVWRRDGSGHPAAADPTGRRTGAAGADPTGRRTGAAGPGRSGRPGRNGRLPADWPVGGAPFARIRDAVHAVTEEALRERPDRPPLFLYVHLLYAHAPYDPPPGFAGTLAEASRAAGIEDPDRIAYLEEIRAMDSRLEELLQPLLDLPHPRGFFLHVLSDHGESFGERGERDHGTNLHAELVHVPWILWGTDLPRRGRVGALVHHLDLLPTLLDTAGLEPDTTLPGRSLLPLLRGESLAARPAPSEFPLLPGRLRRVALRGERWKLIGAPRGPIAAFDLAVDPGEREDLLGPDGTIPEEARPLAGRLKEWIQSRPRGRAGAMPLPDPEAEEALRSLGYGGG